MIFLAWDKETGSAVIPNRMPIDGELCQKTTSTHVSIEQYVAPMPNSDLLEAKKTNRIAVVKVEAAERISALDWKVTKCSERQARGKAQQSDLDSVYDERDAIRTNSDQAELDIQALETIEDVENFTW